MIFSSLTAIFAIALELAAILVIEFAIALLLAMALWYFCGKKLFAA